MPITKIEFHTAVEQGVEDLMNRIREFLAAERESAYSEGELKAKLSIGNDRGTQVFFLEALRALEGLEAIRWGIVEGDDYYIYNQELAPASSAR
jgi:hypothetical protein